MEELSKRMCESLDELIDICSKFILMVENMMPEIESTRKNKLAIKTAASSFGVAAIALSAGAIFAPVTAGGSLALGISAVVATTANGGLAVSAGVYKNLKTKFFTKFLGQKKKILKNISKQFETFYEIISKTKEFQEIATLNGQSRKKKINLMDKVELLSKFLEELQKHQKIIVELREVIVTPNTSEQKYDLISSESVKGTVTLSTYVIAHRSTPDSKIDEFLIYDIILETTGIKKEKSNRNRIPKLSKFLQVFKDSRVKISVTGIAAAGDIGAKIFRLVNSAAKPAASAVIRNVPRSASTIGMTEVASKAGVGIKTVSTPVNAVGKGLFGLGVVLTAVDLYFLVRDWRNEGRIKETIKKLEQEVLYYEELSELIKCIKIINYDEIHEFTEI